MLVKLIKEHKWLAIIAAVLILGAAACCIGIRSDVNMLKTQYVWRDWKGDSEDPYSQISVFIPENNLYGINDVNSFRSKMVQSFEEASLNASNSNKLFVDCWSSSGTASVATDRSYGTTSALAVGGEFFDFHPLKLLDGNYFQEGDLNREGVVVDGRLAWFLFGAIDVAGLEVNVDGHSCVIVGVVDLEEDFASKKSDNSEMMLFLNYELYSEIHSAENNYGISCYEVVLPNPVKNFALNLVTENIGATESEIVEITNRFSLSNIFKSLRSLPSSVINKGIALPYWENAARYTLNCCALLLGIAILCLILVPVPVLLVLLVKYLIKSQNHFRYEVMVDLMEKAEEAVRVQERKQWEKKHGSD